MGSAGGCQRYQNVVMKSGISRIRELYPDNASFEAHVRANPKIRWALLARRNPMGVVAWPGTAWIGMDDLPSPVIGPRYAAFSDDLYGIRAGVMCLAKSDPGSPSGASLLAGLTKLTRDEFAAESMLRRMPADWREMTPAKLCGAIISLASGAAELFQPALIRAAVALAADRAPDKTMVARVLARVA